jgi:glycosyltransferase involved in cell wall biosynthesis
MCRDPCARAACVDPVDVFRSASMPPFPTAAPMDLPRSSATAHRFVRRLESVKGLDVLLDAFGRLRPRAASRHGDGPERQRFVGTRAHVLRAVPYPRCWALKALDVLVLPSVLDPAAAPEQFGRVLVEAWRRAYGGWFVVGAIPEVIGDAACRPRTRPQRWPKHRPRALGCGVARAACRRGRRRAATRFDWPVVAEQTLALFRSAMLHRRRAPARLEEVRA